MKRGGERGEGGEEDSVSFHARRAETDNANGKAQITPDSF